MAYQHTIGNFNSTFPDLKTVLAKAGQEKSGDKIDILLSQIQESQFGMLWGGNSQFYKVED